MGPTPQKMRTTNKRYLRKLTKPRHQNWERIGERNYSWVGIEDLMKAI